MSDPILIIDSNYMAHRAFHSVGELAHGSEGTGVVFGVLRDVLTLQEQFQTGRCVFCFDHPALKHRHTDLPTYKSSRRARYDEETNEEKQARKEMQQQIKALYREYLPEVGFKNVFAACGFEADDIIAKIAATLPPGEEGIIVSSDQDLWQCISVRPRVMCWNPQKSSSVTYSGFIKKWGFLPSRWAEVKAIAGCKTDDVPGIQGVGEITAAKYIRGELGAHTKAFKAIEDGEAAWQANMRLVDLPYPETPDFELRPDKVTEEKWQALADKLGMRSIKSATPRTASRKKRGRKREGFFT